MRSRSLRFGPGFGEFWRVLAVDLEEGYASQQPGSRCNFSGRRL
jgi:hypothetical protein